MGRMGMRKYVTGTGIVGVVLSGITMLRGSDEQRFTWRIALAWISWGLSLILAIGMILDIRRVSRGGSVDEDSPLYGREEKYRHGE